VAPVNDEPAKRLGLKSGLGLALAYCALGSLGLLLSVPPAEASPLFPAAGFALVCALLWGAPAMAVAWVGSFALNLVQMAIAGTLAPTPVASAAVVAAGVALQAWIGARLGAPSGLALPGQRAGRAPVHLARRRAGLRGFFHPVRDRAARGRRDPVRRMVLQLVELVHR